MDGNWPIDADQLDDDQVLQAIENIRAETRYPLIAEGLASDGEDDQDANSSDDDGFDWYAEMVEGDETYTNVGLGIEDTINEDFEQELADFGIASLFLSCTQLLMFSPQLRKSLMKKLLTFATSHSRLRAI